MSTELESSFEYRVVVLGNDAQLFARPATPVQLAQACFAAGYSFVAPASWGDELIARHAIEAVAQGPAVVSVLCQCPFVAESLRALPEMLHPVWTTVSPPVAVARYLRAAFAPSELHITYVGNCPGAAAADIDAHILPENFIAGLIDLGIVPGAQSTVYQGMLPPDRSRFASLAGGIPHPDELQRRAEAELQEVVGITLEAVARVCAPNVRTLFTLSRGSGCVCARDRAMLAAIEPPRSLGPVIDEDIQVEVVPVIAGDEVTVARYRPDPEEPPEGFVAQRPVQDTAAVDAEHGAGSPLASGVLTPEERDAMLSAGYSAYWAIPEATERDAPARLPGGEKVASSEFSGAEGENVSPYPATRPHGGGETHRDSGATDTEASSEERITRPPTAPAPPLAAPGGETELGDPEAYPTFDPPERELEFRRSGDSSVASGVSSPQRDLAIDMPRDRSWHDRFGRLAARHLPSAASGMAAHQLLPHLVNGRSRGEVCRYPSESWWSIGWRRTAGLLALGIAGIFADIGRSAPTFVRESSEDRAPAM